MRILAKVEWTHPLISLLTYGMLSANSLKCTCNTTLLTLVEVNIPKEYASKILRRITLFSTANYANYAGKM